MGQLRPSALMYIVLPGGLKNSKDGEMQMLRKADALTPATSSPVAWQLLCLLHCLLSPLLAVQFPPGLNFNVIWLTFSSS